MLKKIVIAISDNFIRNLYRETFEKEGFDVTEAKAGQIALELIEQELPDIVIADVDLYKINGFELLHRLKEKERTSLIPVIIFAQVEKQDERTKALDIEAKDFIVSSEISPFEAVKRVKIILGEQKSYKLTVDINSPDVKKMAQDIGYPSDLKCLKCGAPLVLYAIRNLKAGKNHFIVSFICPECD